MAKALRTQREQLIFAIALSIGFIGGAYALAIALVVRDFAYLYWDEIIIGCIRGASVLCAWRFLLWLKWLFSSFTMCRHIADSLGKDFLQMVHRTGCFSRLWVLRSFCEKNLICFPFVEQAQQWKRLRSTIADPILSVLLNLETTAPQLGWCTISVWKSMSEGCTTSLHSGQVSDLVVACFAMSAQARQTRLPCTMTSRVDSEEQSTPWHSIKRPKGYTDS